MLMSQILQLLKFHISPRLLWRVAHQLLIRVKDRGMKGESHLGLETMLEQLCASQSSPWTLLKLLPVKVTEFKGTNPALKWQGIV